MVGREPETGESIRFHAVLSGLDRGMMEVKENMGRYTGLF
jgi:hypothetical protein